MLILFQNSATANPPPDGEVTISPYDPSASWQASWELQPAESVKFTVTVEEAGNPNGTPFELEGNPTVAYTEPNTLWTQTTNSSPYEFEALNTGLTVIQDTVKVSVVWKEQVTRPSGGGGGAPPEPETIDGLASGTVYSEIAVFEWNSNPKVQFADGESMINFDVSATVNGAAFDLAGYTITGEPAWTINSNPNGNDIAGTVKSSSPSEGQLQIVNAGNVQDTSPDKIGFAELDLAITEFGSGDDLAEDRLPAGNNAPPPHEMDPGGIVIAPFEGNESTFPRTKLILTGNNNNPGENGKYIISKENLSKVEIYDAPEDGQKIVLPKEWDSNAFGNGKTLYIASKGFGATDEPEEGTLKLKYQCELNGNPESLEDEVKIRVITIGIAVDSNRDGQVEFGVDKTSSSAPYRFWINNDHDSEEDKVEVYDSNSQPDHADDEIPTQRDLEDHARIQMMVGGLHDEIKSEEIQITMKFKSGTVAGSPAINLRPHLDESGGRNYLKDEPIAARHVSQQIPGRLTTGNGVVFFPTFWTGDGIENFPAITSEKPYRYQIFEGASEGKGELVLELMKDGEILGEAGSCWVHLLDVRKMYQRAKITPDGPNDFSHPHDFKGDPDNQTATPPVPNIGWTWDPNEKPFVEDPEEEKEYIIFVHGWRMTYEGSQKYAETMFKRLWQTGFKGRYAFVRWPTYSDETHPITNGLFTYNPSDYRAWISGKGVALFVNSLSTDYTRNITAHSMGNIVVGSALREGMHVGNYALLNAAVPAMCYDGNEDLYELIPNRETPDGAGDDDPITKELGFNEKINGIGIEEEMINFFLESDDAMGAWAINNKGFKPELLEGYRFNVNREPGERVYNLSLFQADRYLRSFHESAAYATASKTKALGGKGVTNGSVTDKVDMAAKYGFGVIHSAQWIWRIQKTDQFYHDLMQKFALIPAN
jgi:hypothetical protein